MDAENYVSSPHAVTAAGTNALKLHARAEMLKYHGGGGLP